MWMPNKNVVEDRVYQDQFMCKMLATTHHCLDNRIEAHIMRFKANRQANPARLSLAEQQRSAPV